MWKTWIYTHVTDKLYYKINVKPNAAQAEENWIDGVMVTVFK
jgi:hypothetical protein